jgi:hypothetical protein
MPTWSFGSKTVSIFGEIFKPLTSKVIVNRQNKNARPEC